MFRNILIAVDADRRADALKLLALAAELRRCFGASLTIATVLTDWSMVVRAERSRGAADRLGEVARGWPRLRIRSPASRGPSIASKQDPFTGAF